MSSFMSVFISLRTDVPIYLLFINSKFTKNIFFYRLNTKAHLKVVACWELAPIRYVLKRGLPNIEKYITVNFPFPHNLDPHYSVVKDSGVKILGLESSHIVLILSFKIPAI